MYMCFSTHTKLKVDGNNTLPLASPKEEIFASMISLDLYYTSVIKFDEILDYLPFILEKGTQCKALLSEQINNYFAQEGLLPWA